MAPLHWPVHSIVECSRRSRGAIREGLWATATGTESWKRRVALRNSHRRWPGKVGRESPGREFAPRRPRNRLVRSGFSVTQSWNCPGSRAFVLWNDPRAKVSEVLDHGASRSVRVCTRVPCRFRRSAASVRRGSYLRDRRTRPERAIAHEKSQARVPRTLMSRCFPEEQRHMNLPSFLRARDNRDRGERGTADRLDRCRSPQSRAGDRGSLGFPAEPSLRSR
jgi:hypothetical protein